jgi:predicted acyl esterase
VSVRLPTRQILLSSLALLIAFVGWRYVVSRTSSAFVKANYTKREYRIPMRDGVKLFTQVYAPKDSSHLILSWSCALRSA